MLAARFYNSFTKTIEPLSARYPGKIRIYNCGPTVYKRQHIGNMRRYLFADFLRRSLELLGFEVKEIMNITDVGHLTQDEVDAGEDKLEVAAREAKVTPQDIAQRQIKLFFDDIQALAIQPAHAYPRATQFVPQMQKLIKELIARRHAYITASGVYFDVQSFPDYGKLSGNTLQQLAAGKRVEIRTEKKHPADFALWIVDPHHLQRWDSPWGAGYPGWHIECSAMSLEYLGSDIDIHAGGEDNRFPHHENELAQSEAATRKRFVRLWMHNSHLRLSGKKLAKREGQQITLDTIRERGFSPLAFRLFVFGAHYRTPLEFSWEALAEAQQHLEAFKGLLRRLRETLPPASLHLLGKKSEVNESVVGHFAERLADDLTTPGALAVLMDYVRSINVSLESPASTPQEQARIYATLKHLDHVLGIFEPLERELENESVPPEIRRLVAEREQARREHKFERADELRGAIEKKGFQVEDTNSGPRIVSRGK
jgi:cysteinyl-tRNA synthetase